uniref:Reverse transcriptase Ty1/copia-type domain-containing protein n=1 Tax=Lactuca sativa TaxID=4236 RepID=A0A9R1VQF9_LACSA|nr:hypothetical protein LSAT_V11C400193820 [Lactuca sativa]
MDRYKACHVAQGFTQILGLDYSHTFSLVIKASTIQIILSLEFLYDHLSETVFMEQPPGFVGTRSLDHIFRLYKALYGLKQAPRAWFQPLSNQESVINSFIARLHNEFARKDLGDLNSFLELEVAYTNDDIFLG